MRSERAAALLALTIATPLSGQALPPTPAIPVTDRYGVASIVDPYRWLEGDVASPAIAAWTAAQNRHARAYLDAIPERRAIAARINALSDFERLGAPVTAGGRQFFFKRDRGDEQPSYWVRDGEDGPARKLLDPLRWAADGSSAIASVQVAPARSLLAFAVQEAGSDWRTWHVMDVASGHELPDAISWNKYSDIAWDADGRGFVYTRFSATDVAHRLSAGNRNERLYHHRLGDPQSADRLLYSDTKNPDFMFIGQQSEDGRYLVVNYGYNGGGVRTLVRDRRIGGPFRDLFPKASDDTLTNRFIGARGDTLYLLSTIGALNGRIVAVRSGRGPARPRIVVPEQQSTLVSATLVGGRLFASYLVDAKSSVRVFDVDGSEQERVALPEAGSAKGFLGFGDSASTYFEFSSFARPPSVYRYDITTGRTALVSQPAAPLAPGQYRTEQVFFTARDGKRIAMFLAGKGDLTPTGDRPVLLYGYGGFGLSFPPDFRPEQVTWMDMGGIFAFPALPGGGEYGEQWHRAGTLKNKPAVFDAFVDAAQYLIDHRYTVRERLAIFGYSNGGLLIGAAMTRRPDLFAVALPTVGVLDMLRFTQFTNGRLWASEYGDPKDRAMFPVLRGYSPYHSIRPGRDYPATLIGTADHDDRVYPAHSLKFAARLQADAAPGRPVLLSVETKAGHGAGTARSLVVAEAADRLAFTLANLKFHLPPAFPDGDAEAVEPSR